MNCYLGRAISLETSYGDMSGNLAENARFAEYGSYGPGYTVNNKRPYLTSAQAAKFKTDTVMGTMITVQELLHCMEHSRKNRKQI